MFAYRLLIRGENPGSRLKFRDFVCYNDGLNGPLAQLVEQLTLNQLVRSSSLRRVIFYVYGHGEGWMGNSQLSGIGY